MNRRDLAAHIRDIINERATPDSDDWAIARIAQLRASGENATAQIVWAGRLFTVKVRRENGEIESGGHRW